MGNEILPLLLASRKAVGGHEPLLRQPQIFLRRDFNQLYIPGREAELFTFKSRLELSQDLGCYLLNCIQVLFADLFGFFASHHPAEDQSRHGFVHEEGVRVGNIGGAAQCHLQQRVFMLQRKLPCEGSGLIRLDLDLLLEGLSPNFTQGRQQLLGRILIPLTELIILHGFSPFQLCL